MRKEDILGLLIFLIDIAAGFVVAYTILPNYSVDFMGRFAFVMFTAIIAFILNGVGLELLHALGGKIGGYEVSLINIFGFQFEKLNNKWKFSYKDYNGLLGETKLAPKKDKLNLKPYVWAPTIGYIVEVVVGAVLLIVMKQNESIEIIPSWIGLGAIIFITISSMLALYNLFPVRLNSMNDGYRLRLLSDAKNTEALNELFRVENLLRQGFEVDEIKTFENINDFTTGVNLFYVYEKLAKKDHKEALRVIDLMLAKQESLSTETVYRLLAQKMYVLTMDNIDKAKEFYDEEVKDKARVFIANDKSAESIRAYVLIAGLIDKSQSEVELVKKRFARVNSESLEARKNIEQKLFEEAVLKVEKEHPEWVKENIAA